MIGIPSFQRYFPASLVELNRGKTFTITDCASDGAIYLKDQAGENYVIDINRNGKVEMDRFDNTDEKVEKLETLIVALAEKMGLSVDEVLEEATRLVEGDAN